MKVRSHATLRGLCLTSLVVVAVCGCGSSGPAPVPVAPAPSAVTPSAAGESWWGLVLTQVRSASGNALVTIHDGTGWLLGKNKVDIEQVGDFEEVDDVKFATYRITVSRSDESFSSEIEDIECDELGIPTEQSQEKMEEAVAKIKDMLDRLQS